MIKKYLFLCLVLLAAVSVKAAPVTIIEQGGWFESGYVTWQKAAGMEYNVYVSPAASASWTKLDDELVREYPSYGRADALGLKAGSYQFKVVPVADGDEQTADAAISQAVQVKAHDRSGFAHKRAGTDGIGAYNNDGTLKDNARVVYVWADNAKTVSLDVVSGSNGKTTTYTGLQQIIYGYQKGDANGSYDKRPLCVRIIGTIKESDMDTFLSSAEGIQIKGAKAYQPLNMTIEGVGNDATIYGFGFLIRNVAKVELRNFGIMLCMDDAVSIDTDNEMIWVHNLDIFYGKAGSDADQAKGDGTIDLKGDSRYMTISYNHLYDSGKASLCGMKSETGPNWITYHHNWFDHSDSRHPRIRTMSVHVWNNYFDGNSKYGVGAAYNSEAFVENNYFRNCKYPMLSSLQGSDVAGGGKGTFSGENGGVIKSFGNFIKNARSVVTYQQDQTEFDCWEAPSRDAKVPASVKAKVGGHTYSNFDTNTDLMYDYTPDAAEAVPGIVKGQYGAGRMQHGDFTWTFNNSVQDENYNVINDLKSTLQSYRSTLVGFFEGQQIRNGGAVNTVDAGDGKGLTDEQQDYTPYWAGGGGVVTAGLPDPRFCGPETESGSKIYDYLWFNAANATAINGYISDGWLTYSEGGSFNGTRELKSSDGTITSKYTGSMQIPQGGSVTFKCEKGFLSVAATIFRTGSASGEIQLSKNGTSFSKIADYAASKGDATISASGNEAEGPVYIRITNKASGSLHITGIKIMYPDPDGTPDTPEPEEPEDPDEPQLSDDATADFTMGGNPVSFVNNTATVTLAFDDPTTTLSVSVTPAEGATISSVSGATGSAGSYTITAPEGGKSVTATFTITAENGKTKKNYAITVKRTAESSAGGEDDDSNTDLVLYFKGQTPSNTTFYSITSPAYKTKYGSETYKGITSDVSLEPQSATKITFTTTKDATLVMVYGTQGKNKDIKLDGEKTTATEIAIAAGQHTLEKASASVEIFFIDLVYGDGGGQPGGGDDPTPQPSTKTVFSTTATAALSVSALSSVEITSDNATTTGGKIYAVNNFTNDDKPDGEAKNMIKTQSKVVAFQHTNNTTYFKIELDEALQAGDVISSKAYLRDDTAIGLWLTPSEERPSAEPNTKMVSDKISTTGWGELPTYTITADDGLAGVKTFYIHRATDKSTYFTDFTITRPSTTGINNVNVNLNDNGCLYDLMGRRVDAPKAGKVYIKGGKKFIMR